MFNVFNTVTISALCFSNINALLNFYLLFSVFCRKKIQKKADLSLIICKFVVDMFYSFDNSLYLAYILIRVISPDLVVKNLAFYIAWPNFNLGSIRCWVVFFIAFDRVLATCAPIFYHNHRFKISILPIAVFVFCYTAFEQYILFELCDYVIDVPLECNIFRCAVEACYHNYWKWYQQIMQACIGTLTLILFFRLFIWNNCTKVSSNKTISRATRISLLDSFIIFAFDFFPVFLTARWPNINSTTVGPLGSLCKNFGFVIESIIICHVLLGNKKVAPASISRTSPTHLAAVM